ncbi:MAG TPA: hypothetical protein VLE26_08255 [Alphaproteobacteria bacterium]|jgi:hypothetical protein|nr:hypothetical protein [Alphaproteobacteria bacterium]
MRTGHASRRILALAILGCLLALMALIVAPHALRFLAEDDCLDAGGIWLEPGQRCEGARPEG